MHLSHAPQTLLAGFFGKLDYAIIEATDVTRDGRVYLTTSIGASPTYLRYADRVFIEINDYHSKRLPEMADILVLPPPPRLDPIPIHDPLTKIGYPYATVDPKKIIGIIESNEPDRIKPFATIDWKAKSIADNVVRFLFGEMISGRIPPEYLPFQAGVGNLANSIMAALGQQPLYSAVQNVFGHFPGLAGRTHGKREADGSKRLQPDRNGRYAQTHLFEHGLFCSSNRAASAGNLR